MHGKGKWTDDYEIVSFCWKTLRIVHILVVLFSVSAAQYFQVGVYDIQ